MNIWSNFRQWLSNPRSNNPPLVERMRIRARAREEARIMNLARQLWEEEGKIWRDFEGVKGYYRAKAEEKLNSQKKNLTITLSTR